MFVANRISLCRHLTQLPTTTAAHRCIANVATVTSIELDPRKMIEKQLACEVKVNKKKPWSSTAVLEALEGTLGSSPTPGYDMISSPHFHISNQRKDKMKYKKSGIEAANYAISNIEDSFRHSWDSDNVQVWLNNSQQLANTTATGEELIDGEQLDDTVGNIMKAIDTNQMEVAVRIFRKLKDEQVEMGDDVINRLFAYVSFYLGSSTNKREFQFKPIGQNSSLRLNSSLVDSVFNLIEKPTREQYNVYIRASFHLGRFDEAIDIYHQHMQGKMDLDVDSVNALLVCSKRSKNTSAWSFRTEMMKHMNTVQICPNHETFFSMIYFNVVHVTDINEFQHKCQRIFAEMQHCGLEVSMQIYGEILRAISSKKNADVESVNEKIDVVLDMVENDNTSTCNTPRDAVALSGMMKLLGNRGDLARVKRLYGIGTSGNKRRLMKNMDYEEFFYSYYMFALLKLDTLKNIWIAKCQLIPSKTRFTGRHIVMYFDAIKREEAYQYIPLLMIDLMKDARASSVVHELFDFVVAKWDDMDEDTQTQLKHIAIINFKAPNFVLKVPRTVDADEQQNQKERILNRSLQILSRCGDQSHTRFALQRLDKFDMKITAETRNDLEGVREKHRLDELLRRIRLADE